MTFDAKLRFELSQFHRDRTDNKLVLKLARVNHLRARVQDLASRKKFVLVHVSLINPLSPLQSAACPQLVSALVAFEVSERFRAD
jgi:glycerol-3-phosphate responsive antiterminator